MQPGKILKNHYFEKYGLESYCIIRNFIPKKKKKKKNWNSKKLYYRQCRDCAVPYVIHFQKVILRTPLNHTKICNIPCENASRTGLCNLCVENTRLL